MDKQSHFEPKATLRAASAFNARHPFAVLEGVLPVVGSTPSILSFLMSAHFLSIWTCFYGVRPVQYLYDHLSKVVKGSF
jgi:hypothetical protein